VTGTTREEGLDELNVDNAAEVRIAFLLWADNSIKSCTQRRNSSVITLAASVSNSGPLGIPMVQLIYSFFVLFSLSIPCLVYIIIAERSIRCN